MGQGGCERRSEVFVKVQKGGGGGVRVDLNKELKFFLKIQKKILGGGAGRGSGRRGGGVGGGGHGGCERRSEVFVKIQKNKFGGGDGGSGQGGGGGGVRVDLNKELKVL